MMRLRAGGLAPGEQAMLLCPTRSLSMVVSAFFASAAFLLLTSSPGFAASPTYLQLKLDPKYGDSKTLSNLKKAKQNVITGKMTLSEGKEFLDQFYAEYVLRAMTRHANLGRVADMRLGILKDLARTRSPDVRTYVLGKVFNKRIWARINAKNLHPAVRYNLLLLLGQLNEREAELRGSNKQPPIPHLKVLKFLILAYNDKDQIDAVRIAALLGMRRHVELRVQMTGSAAIGSDDRENVAALALDLAKAQEPPAGRSASGHDWMRRRAVEILGRLASPGKENEIETALTEIIANAENSIALRCDTAHAIGRINLEKSDEKAATLAKHVGLVAVAACESEFARLDEMFNEAIDGRGITEAFQPRGPRGANFLMPGDLYGGLDDEENKRRVKIEILDERTLPTRRKLIHQLQCVKEGLTGSSRDDGIMRLASAELQTPIQSMTGQIDEIVKVLSEPGTILEDLADQLQKETLKLSSMVAVGITGATEKPVSPEDTEESSDLEELEADDTFDELDF